MSIPSKNIQSLFQNTQYYHINNQLEQQTNHLLKQRQSYMINYQKPLLKLVQSQQKINRIEYNNLSQYNQRKTSQKFQELINLTRSQHNKDMNQQDFSKTTNSQPQNNRNNQVHNNKYNQQNQSNYIDNNPIIQAQGQSSLQYGSRQQIISKIELSPLNQNQKSFIKVALQTNSKLKLSDDVLQMIEQIQLKALNEIDKLKQDKLELMRQLKKEIQTNNQLQKQLNSRSQENKIQKERNFKNGSIQEQMLMRIRFEMDTLIKQNQHLYHLLNQQKNHSQFSQNSSNQVLELKNRLNFYETELRNRDKVIEELMINRNIQNPSQIIQLLQQSQDIRQNTIHLIRLKQANNINNINNGLNFSEDELIRRIHELEELLYREQQEKQSFLNDLLAFKQKYQQLQDENKSLKRISQNTFTTNSKIPSFSPIHERYSDNQLGSLEDYEKVLSQMQRNKF